MPPFKKHVFVCTSCEGCPGFGLLKELRQALKRHGLKEEMRVQGTGCFDACDYEDSVVAVYPDGVWYGKVAVEDVEEIVQSHLVEGVPLERKRIDFQARTVGGVPLPVLPTAPPGCEAAEDAS